jgi:hypothetical protein
MQIIWAIVKFMLLIGGFMAVLSASDLIVGLAIRVVPGLAEWLDSLPLAK